MKKLTTFATILCLAPCFQAFAEETPAAPEKPVTEETPKEPNSFTKEQWVAMEKVKWEKNGWNWNQEKVEANFAEMDVNKDGKADGKERKEWYEKKAAQQAAEKAAVPAE